MTLKRVEDPVEFPITVDDARANSRVPDDADGDLINGLIAAAVARAERETGRAFAPQTWVMFLDAFPAGEIVVPLGPVSDHVEITFDSTDGGEIEISPDEYRVDTAAADARIAPVGAWPVAADHLNAVRVRVEIGAEECPRDVRQAIILMVGHWYENRETASERAMQEMPLGARALLSLHRRMFV